MKLLLVVLTYLVIRSAYDIAGRAMPEWATNIFLVGIIAGIIAAVLDFLLTPVGGGK